MEHKLANDGKIYNIVQIRKYTETSVQCGTCCQITRRENSGTSIPVTKTISIFFFTPSFWQYLKCQVSISKMVNEHSFNYDLQEIYQPPPQTVRQQLEIYSPQEYKHKMVGENLKIYGAFFEIPSEACGMFKKGIQPTVDMILQY